LPFVLRREIADQRQAHHPRPDDAQPLQRPGQNEPERRLDDDEQRVGDSTGDERHEQDGTLIVAIGGPADRQDGEGPPDAQGGDEESGDDSRRTERFDVRRE
jgi:hypothetical protein